MPRRLGFLASAAAIYVVLPLGLMSGPVNTDNHYLATLQDVDARPGKPIEMDRRPVFEANGAWRIETYAGEIVDLVNFDPPSEGTYSIRGRFVSESLVAVQDWHLHGGLRDIASVAGLSLTGTWFLLAFIISRTGRSRRTLFDAGPPPQC
jgi:hypothetical protein